MRTEDVLAAARVGIWTWDDARGVVTMDAVAAELFGLAAEPVVLTEATVRARIHVEDFAVIERVLAIAASEGPGSGPREVEFRLIGPDNEVTTRLRTRLRILEPRELDGGEEGSLALVGTLTETPTSDERELGGDWETTRARETFVLRTGQALSEANSVREVLRVVSTLAMPGFTPDGVAVYDREGDHLRMLDYQGRELDFSDMGFPMPMDTDYPAAEVMRTGRAVYVSSPEEYAQRYPKIWPVIAPLQRSSWAYLPLVVAGRTIGVWLAAFDYRLEFDWEERSTFSSIARMVAQALSRATLNDTERELAADLQHAMGPSPMPRVPGLAIAARYVPTGAGLQVGGDWYDVIPLPSGRVALVIGDVQGHDVRAAAVMAQLRIALRAYASEGHHPDAVLSRASRFLASLSPRPAGDDEMAAVPNESLGEGRFATCLYVEADPRSGTFDMARAGHPEPALLFDDGAMQRRPTDGGPPLGIEPSLDYPVTRLSLQPGETLLLCTDGLLETGKRDLDAGWERVRRAAAGVPGTGLEQLADTLLESISVLDVQDQEERSATESRPPGAHGNEDDIALLLLRRETTGRQVPRGGTPVRRFVLNVGQSEPARIGQAREQLASLLYDWSDRNVVHGAVLMLSEIVTNVLTHTDGDALMVAEVSGVAGSRTLRVEVTDSSDKLPHRREPGELASSGRGLLLMEELADAWGAQPRGEGKTTWFELGEHSGLGTA
ncbi:SpoIIE family protein phosphatase [Streptomyces sp. 3MP-14]|uniref:protein-serine/threonine phosphatase n=1 Tax=Streptomyces mimosae TaxID=2586635 RepID=A0A5N5ZR55_9ACTN|nr:MULTISPECIES: SpoIIE family protein phosphatase [Streptomyces]KAB8158372.1 SpoIIE family protein phosphatase [Streptomyces mimosae]KAB8172565.1 SpoIIE family protein phosphatase [Streptomyces sp. 3MP-14]